MFVDQLNIFYKYNLIKRWQNIFVISYFYIKTDSYLRYIQNQNKIVLRDDIFRKYFFLKTFLKTLFKVNTKIGIKTNVINNNITKLENNIINSSSKT